MTYGRQPLWLPSRFPAWRMALVAMALAVAGMPASAQSPENEIRLVVVDSIRQRSLDDPDLSKPLPQPLGDAVAAAAAAINARGGVLGRRIIVSHDNDACAASGGAEAAARIAGQKPDVVIGHVCSSGAIRASALYAEARILMIAAGPRHPRLTAGAGRPSIFRLAGRDDRQADAIAAMIAVAFPAARVGIVHDQSLQSRGMVDDLRRSADAAKVAPVLIVNYPSGVKDHATIVGQLVEAKIDLAVFPGPPFEASMILDRARRAGGQIKTTIGTDVLAVDAPPQRLLASTGEFLVMLPWPGVPDATPAEASDALPAESWPGDPRLAVAAIEAWAQAVTRAGRVEVDAVAAALRSQESPTSVGPLRFDDKGDAIVPSFVPHVWRDDRWQVRR